jgi:uncharacterized protein
LQITPLEAAGSTLTGIIIGFLGGLFGKGGSAVATPLLRLLGLPAFVSVASPLPATIPGTFVASIAYLRKRYVNWQIVVWSLSLGLPSCVAGAFYSDRVGGEGLLILTALLILLAGVLIILRPARVELPEDGAKVAMPSFWRWRLAGIAVAVGLVSGLLANAGGFLLVPCYVLILRRPIKESFGSSLVVAGILAIPTTLVHWYLGHISWMVAALVGLGSVPLSLLGARVAIRTQSSRLEWIYGVALVILGTFFIFYH